MPSLFPPLLSPSWHAIQCVKLSTVLAPTRKACVRAFVRRGVHYGKGKWGLGGMAGRSVCLTGQQGQHCRCCWQWAATNQINSNIFCTLYNLLCALHFSFHLSLIPRAHQRRQAKCVRKRGETRKGGEREGRSVVLQCNAQCNFILFAAFLSYFVNAFHVIIQLSAVGWRDNKSKRDREKKRERDMWESVCVCVCVYVIMCA